MTAGDEAIAPLCRRAFAIATARGWRSYDPYDLLLAPFGDAIRRRSPLAARILVQVGMRCGPRIRRLLGVRPHEESKAAADFLLASALLVSSGNCGWAESLPTLLIELLRRLSVATPSGRGWALSFPYASRFVSAPAHQPNAYTTVSCVSALATAGARLGDKRAIAAALEGALALTTDIGTVTEDHRTWFRYWPGLDMCIINIQALIAAALQQLGRLTGNESLLAHARLAALTTLAAQREDGSFPYALDERGDFVDAFHTGFVLEGLTRFQQTGGSADGQDIARAVSQGLDYFRSQLMTASHLPRTGPGGRAITDGQNIGQLVQTLALCGNTADRAVARDVWLSHATRALSDGDGSRLSLRWDLGPVVAAGAYLTTPAQEG